MAHAPTTVRHDPRRPHPRDLIRRRPLLCFFLLAFGLTWLAWAPYILSSNGTGVLDFRFPEPLGDPQLLGILPGAYLGPVGSAFVVTAVADGRAGLRRWARRLVRWRIGWGWYPSILIAVPAVAILATLVLPGALADFRAPALTIVLAYPVVLLLQLLTTGLAEEPGWRDFAQHRMQRRYGPLAGTLILAPLWGGWHVPLFLTEWAGSNGTPLMAAELVAATIPLSIVITWVFNRTGESLPAVMLLHANVNTVFSVAWEPMFPHLDGFRDSLHSLVIGSAAVAIPLLILTRGRLGYQPAPTEPGIRA